MGARLGRVLVVSGGLLLLGGAAGCSSGRAQSRVHAAASGAPVTETFTGGSGEATSEASSEASNDASGGASRDARRYVDTELGFELSRPSGEWQLDETDERTEEGLVIPVILRNRASGAQVVLQLAPAVATPTQFAERLTHGLRAQPGFTTTDPEPLPLSDSAVGFRFTMGEAVHGKVAVLDGDEDRVFMIMATWPAGAPRDVQESVDAIIGSVHALPVGGGSAPAAQVPPPPMARLAR